MDQNEFDMFEKDLLNVLTKDPEHKLTLTVPFSFWHTEGTKRAAIEAADVHLDSKTGELVFVGGFRKGDPTFTELGAIKMDYNIPLRQVFADMKAAKYDRTDDIRSSVHSAVLNKYYAGSVKTVFNNWDKHPDIAVDDYLKDGDKTAFRIQDGVITHIFQASNYLCPRLGVRTADGGKVIKPDSLTLSQIYRLGQGIRTIADVIQQGKDAFRKERDKSVKQNSTQTERDWEEGECNGLRRLVDDGYPVGVCQVLIDNSLTLSGDLLKPCKTVREQVIHSTDTLAELLNEPMFPMKKALDFVPDIFANEGEAQEKRQHTARPLTF